VTTTTTRTADRLARHPDCPAPNQLRVGMVLEIINEPYDWDRYPEKSPTRWLGVIVSEPVRRGSKTCIFLGTSDPAKSPDEQPRFGLMRRPLGDQNATRADWNLSGREFTLENLGIEPDERGYFHPNTYCKIVSVSFESLSD
jgi:hypothetical protein